MHVSKEILREFIRGSEVAFTIIYNTYHKYIFYTVSSYISDEETAKDLTQEAFIKLYNERKSLKKLEAFHTWFTKLTKNIVMDYLKLNPNRKASNSEFILDNVADTRYVGSMSLPGIDQLSPLEKKILDYHIVFKLKFKDIAEDLDLSMSVVTKMYYNAISTIKSAVEEK